MKIVRKEGMPWQKTGANDYHEHLGLPDKDRTIKGLYDSRHAS